MKTVVTVALAAALSVVFSAIYLTAQQTGPAQVNGCIYHAAAITLTNLQSSAFLCDINGRLKVTTTP